MAPSAKRIEQALLDGTYEVYRDDSDNTTVNKVRKHVEQKLGLEEDFLSSANWKQKSKTLIKERVEKLLDGWEPEPQEAPDPDVGTKRRSVESDVLEPKRQKRAPKVKKVVKTNPDDEASEEEKPRPKKRKGVVAAARKAKTVQLDSEEDLMEGDGATADSEQEHEPSDNQNEETKATKSYAENGSSAKKKESPDNEDIPANNSDHEQSGGKTTTTEEPKPGDEEEEYSDVIDEPVKPKRKKKEKKETSSKAAGASKVSSKKETTVDDPQEAEIKKLQSQLVKCGIRKLWHNELKQYRDDPRAKIRHLKKMLADIGMDGRFSEAKAREIKETRELLAEAEAAQEMNRLWGRGGTGRSSRSKAKAATEAAASDDSAGEEEGKGEEEEGDEDEVTSFAARRRRAQADLAFLGDDSDSD